VYVADNAAQVTITLPTSPALGDVIQVEGTGTGGWALAQADGQLIIIENMAGKSGANAAVISGRQYATIELQYIGDGAFTVLNYTGNVSGLLPGGYVYQGGLTWMPVATNGGNGYIQPDASALCASRINGLYGWRLPTLPELSALYSTYPGTSSLLTGQGWTLTGTWSSTPYSAGLHYAVNLGVGNVGAIGDASGFYVTCVR
jgi:hypothetical protein